MREISGNRPETSPSVIDGLPPYPVGRPFGELLKWHLKIHGTRPTGSRNLPGSKWSNAEFAEAIGLNDDRMISNYFSNKNAPSNIEKICETLFGNNADYNIWSSDLRSAANQLEHVTKPKAYSTQARAIPNILVNLPPRTTNFLWRKRELRWLRSKLVPYVFRRSHSAAIIHSFGGVGKTSLSIEFGYENIKSFAGVWWCDAESTASLIASIARIGDALNIRGKNDDHSVNDAKRVLAHLATQKRTWLLIYDNAPDPKSIREYIPHGSVKVLITSRFSDWIDIGPSYALGVLSLSESIKLLNHIADRTDKDGARRLAYKVGRLPLALNHAAIMCRRCRYTFDEYTDYVEFHIRVPLRAVDYELSVFSVFEITLLEIGLETPAISLLMLLSFCGSAPIPTQLVEKLCFGAPSSASALTILSEISLVQFGSFYEGKRYITVHKIIQSVVRIKAEELSLAHTKATEVCNEINALLPTRLDLREENRFSFEVLTPHIFEIFERDKRIFENVDSFPQMIHMAARYASAMGIHNLADAVLTQCCNLYRFQFEDLNRIFDFETGNWAFLAAPVWHLMLKDMRLPIERLNKLALYYGVLFDRAQNRHFNIDERECFEV